MKMFSENLNRRQFLKNLTVGGMAAVYACSKDPYSGPVNPPSSPTKTTIALHKTSDRVEGVQTVLELLDFPSLQNKQVVLKPNFNTADPPPASTHNDTLRQLILEIRARGASGIVLAERSFQDFSQVISLKGIDIMASELDFTIKNLENDEYSVFSREGLHWPDGFRLPRTISDAEYIISTCCLKTHHTGVITMSLKLSVGILARLHMTPMHSSARINSMIAEINLAYRPQLIVMDGVKTFISGGPSSGTVVDGNVVIAGTDRIAIDAVGTAILKDLGSTRVSGKIFELEQIQRASELRIGITSPNQIEFVTTDEESRVYADHLKTILANG